LIHISKKIDVETITEPDGTSNCVHQSHLTDTNITSTVEPTNGEASTSDELKTKRKAAKQSNQLHPNDILCDNQASVSIFHNSKLFSNSLAVDLDADVKRFGKVYFYPESIANILHFYDLASK